MGDVFDQLRERAAMASGGACIGQSAAGGSGADVDPTVLAAARRVLPALAGLSYEQARSAIWLTSSALDLSAVVQSTAIDGRMASEIEAVQSGLSDDDRNDAREATLQAYRNTTYVSGLGVCLLEDLKAIKTAS